MFRAIIFSILRSTRVCLELVVQRTDDAAACWWPEHVEPIAIINRIIIVTPNSLFILLYQWCKATQT